MQPLLQVVEALREHNLTLQNFASIREQAIGGFVQVSAHGTGATIPPVDEQVIAMTLVTPGQGTLHLSEVSTLLGEDGCEVHRCSCLHMFAKPD